ncbi:MAG: hypothetical protein WDM78_09555 [Puia sp.]
MENKPLAYFPKKYGSMEDWKYGSKIPSTVNINRQPQREPMKYYFDKIPSWLKKQIRADGSLLWRVDLIY